MPKIRHNKSLGTAHRARYSVTDRVKHIDNAQAGRPCVANDHCAGPLIPGAPVSLCGTHLREVYEFAADMVSERWDGAVREYVADLHATFRPPPSVKQPKAGNVYFLRFGNRIKVGYTTDPTRRFLELPHDEVIGVIPGTRDDETAWHRLLGDYRTVGEWFRAEPEVLDMISQVVAKAG
jgi:hypothetical protein